MEVSRNLKKEYIGAGLVCLAATLWGLDGIVLTPRLYQLNVAYVVFVLHLLPFLGMSLLFGRSEIKKIVKLPKSDLFYYFLIALFGGSIGTLAIVKALFIVNFNHLTVVTLLQKLQPVFAIVLARIILGEKIGKNFIFWAIVALMSGYILTFQFHLPQLHDSEHIGLACIYAIIAAFSFGSSTVFGKRILSNSSFLTAMYTRYMFTSIIMFLIVGWTGNFHWFTMTTKFQWMIFCIIAMTTGSGAVLLYYKGLKSIKANVATICELCFPVSSILFDYIFNGHLLSEIQSIAVIILLFSIYRITKNQK
ncbi:MAG: DMT family transporter [Cetobacterium sp.]|uniref:Permease of the drug/metabolite transporter (DMT) superfamily n=1 Tax=Cetobacterium ceti TaxID=180163 RepID=A0A1T4KJV4_9FUSO|nr:DMT family transporter [Cetobacterium ceti]MCJ8342047.1 DMT family transporter [Cetobacterium sp.]SJZ42684.1 Permease of the drug/metabolite transporter (DMT) superfamily [Cetobacterium ceti]